MAGEGADACDVTKGDPCMPSFAAFVKFEIITASRCFLPTCFSSARAEFLQAHERCGVADGGQGGPRTVWLRQGARLRACVHALECIRVVCVAMPAFVPMCVVCACA